ncbi:M36 family metallopeptidase [Nannocystis punicea]|uniref:M36 family metallopeptidase n=1 Tax=Nannocystis punicea TaxID=2995304 RepID=A0ABY7HDH0_9BACT|nr:M36 family metallopeptidase [Nannocystis poenicansa]WAS97142.1 M36 family metallopeptidase [Nannocystis poenicansa]
MHRRSRIGFVSCGYLLTLTAALAPAYASGSPAPAIAAEVAGDAVVASRHDGVPSFVWASGPAPRGASPEQAARHHLERLRPLYAVPRAALADARLVHVHDTGRGGIVVILRPTVGGVDVMHSDVKVLLDRGLGLRAIGGSPHPAALASSARAASVSAPAGVSAAVRDLFGVDVPADRWVATRSADAAGRVPYTLAKAPAGLRVDRPARVRPVYFPVGRSLVPAHRVEVQATPAGGEPEAFVYVIAADDGRVLARSDAKQHDAFSYRVWADEEGDRRPLEGPLQDYTPHPLGEPSGEMPAGVAPGLVSMEGFNTNPDGAADPWLPPGATETNGNNVDAYANHGGDEKLGVKDFRATVTAPGSFDRAYDLTKEPIADHEQSMAAVTQLFYVTNWMHDWWYDSGFNEGAGNAQVDNFGRGGAGGDPLLALAQDDGLGQSRDNAFMVTLEDGESPHMHMFLYSALSTDLSLTVDDQPLAVGQAGFGPKIYDVTAELVVVDDGMGKSPTDGCEPPLNDLAGKIVLIDRGTCAFELKANLAEAAGAVGVIYPDILSDMPAYPPGPDPMIDDPTIPGQGLSKADGDALKAQLMNGPLTAHMVGNSPPERDGTIDNMVVAHEWGHFIHNRLVECVSWQCRAQGEGWGDFLALHMALRPGEDLDGTYADHVYASSDPTGYFGVRRVPYSVDITKNALTFRHIAAGEPLPDEHPVNDQFGAPNYESHNAGEVWTTMMWEVYVALHKVNSGRKSFDEVRRAMSDYIVTGMMMAPVGPTYTEQRDALLAAMAAADPADYAAAATAFARRGAGTCAVGPGRGSVTFEGVMEDFEVRPLGVIAAAAVDDLTMSCDMDGVVDVGEPGVLNVKIDNLGGGDLAGAELVVTASSPSVTFSGETKLALDTVAPRESLSLQFPFELPEALPGVENVTFTVSMTTPDGCTTETVRELAVVLNGDPTSAASSVDDVEAADTLWTLGGNGGGTLWSRAANASSGKGWHADDADATSDTWLMSPPMKVSADQPLKISFDHAYFFDSAVDADTNVYAWDGGVVEISADQGKSWDDLSKFGDPGYTGTIASSDNPLSNRPGYVVISPSYPLLEHVEVDLGTAFAGQEILVRFRAGTDVSTGAPGWDIDNLGFSGVTNTPFPGWVSDPGDCVGPVPTTSEGEDTSSSSTDAPDEPSTGETDSATGPSQTGQDDGCACRSDAGGGWQGAGLLALAGLLRRRRRSA